MMQPVACHREGKSRDVHHSTSAGILCSIRKACEQRWAKLSSMRSIVHMQGSSNAAWVTRERAQCSAGRVFTWGQRIALPTKGFHPARQPSLVTDRAPVLEL